MRDGVVSRRINVAARSRMMAAVRKANTKPELAVRRLLHRSGFRYVLHQRALPGTPDIVLPSRRTVVFVNGCFWHQHPGCELATRPKVRQDYWVPKLRRNVIRDRSARAKLQAQGWRVIVVWECALGDPAALSARLTRILRRT
jgi:DNA mismatch endonuclease (patch repair protein)